jgi:hypothetical protein
MALFMMCTPINQLNRANNVISSRRLPVSSGRSSRPAPSRILNAYRLPSRIKLTRPGLLHYDEAADHCGRLLRGNAEDIASARRAETTIINLISRFYEPTSGVSSTASICRH